MVNGVWGPELLVDAHAHLDKYDVDQTEHVLAAIERENILTLSVSVDPSSFLRAEAMAQRSLLVIPSFGIHPEQAPSFVGSLDRIEQLAQRSPMIGEIGLDHRFVSDVADYEPQRDVFAVLLQSAKAQGKIVNVHCVGAEQDTLDLMTSCGIERAIIHWYSGPVDVLADMIGAGYWFTVGVEVLHSEHIRRIARLIPADQLLTETDNPGGRLWLTGEPGQPTDLSGIVDELARLRDVPTGDLTAMIRRNFLRLIEGDEHLAPWKPLVSAL
jgi:TatD DNase family protein